MSHLLEASGRAVFAATHEERIAATQEWLLRVRGQWIEPEPEPTPVFPRKFRGGGLQKMKARKPHVDQNEFARRCAIDHGQLQDYERLRADGMAVADALKQCEMTMTYLKRLRARIASREETRRCTP